MARKKKKNIIDVAESRRFLYEVYGLKTKEVTPYELMILHEEFKAKFHWYHTTGKLVRITKRTKPNKWGDLTKYAEFSSIVGRDVKYLTAEDVAIQITEHVQSKITNPNSPLYWDRSIDRSHKANLLALKNKISSYGRATK